MVQIRMDGASQALATNGAMQNGWSISNTMEQWEQIQNWNKQ